MQAEQALDRRRQELEERRRDIVWDRPDYGGYLSEVNCVGLSHAGMGRDGLSGGMRRSGENMDLMRGGAVGRRSLLGDLPGAEGGRGGGFEDIFLRRSELDEVALRRLAGGFNLP
jgi:hypothetical protein